MDAAPRVALVSDEPGWHGARLAAAFARHGCTVHPVPLAAVSWRFGPGGCPAPSLPGFDDTLPAAVFVRGIAAGTLEQVITRLNALHVLRALGVPVINDGRAIERTVDKGLTSALLQQHGLPTPPTWLCEDEAQARAVLAAELDSGHSLVLKPLFGSQGNGLLRIDHVGALPPASEVRGVYYLQRFVVGAYADYRDWRVLVVDGEEVAAMCRRSSHWVTNRAQGARCEPVPRGFLPEGLARRAAAAVGVDYAGVDLLRAADGRWLVGEVNGIPAWQGLQRVTGYDVAAALAAMTCARIPARV